MQIASSAAHPPAAPNQTRDGSAAAIMGAAVEYPSLHTPRFHFSRFVLADIAALAALANKHRIADTTIGVPYPYTHQFARNWISSHSGAWERRRGLHWAARNASDDRIAGYAGLHSMDMERQRAELRFWVGGGVKRRDHGVEWAEALIEFAFSRLGMQRVFALQLARHPFVGHVVSSAGMRRVDLIRKRMFRDGVMEDVVCWAKWR